jgi:hypothetical protein
MRDAASRDCYPYASVLSRHGNEHVMVVRNILSSRVGETHVRQNSEHQSRQTQVKLTQSKTVVGTS